MLQLWVFAGPNGSGKSTFVEHFLCKRLPVVNPDDIARERPNIRPILAGKLNINNSYTLRMEIIEAQYQRIAHCLPRQGGNVSLSNVQVLNAILYVTAHGYKWCELPKQFGNWLTIDTRMNRWSKRGGRERIFTALQQNRLKLSLSKGKRFR